MNNVIMGTAGHVDHGKTCLIRALTGIDTDRLIEEKKRGITIELGFAYLDLPDGGRAGIIDVPGHEKFIKNMLAGAGGIDLAMLIVAADEGVMPQTVEHLGILSLLGIKNGVIVITKKDLVDPDWLELVSEDVRQRVQGTFLESAPIIPVSSYTGEGIDQLRQEIFRQIGTLSGKNLSRPFRLPIDRVFSMEGFGTVITGTLIEGTLSEGQEIEVYPAGLITKARNIQVHSQPAETAYAGQRVAVNLAGLKKSDLKRGDVLAPKGSLEPTMMADVSLSVLPDTSRIIKSGGRLHFYHGAREVLCKAVLLSAPSLSAGQTGYAQLRFEEQVVLKAGDRFVVRFYSPLETVGGGVILDPIPQKRKQGDEQAVAAMKVKESGTAAQRLEQAILERSRFFSPASRAALAAGVEEDELDAALQELENSGAIIKIGSGIYLHTTYLSALRRRLLDVLNEYHKANPLKAGIKQEELRSRLLPGVDFSYVDAIINYFINKKTIKLYSGCISIFSFKAEMSQELEKLASQIEKIYLGAGYAPPATDEVTAQFAKYKQIGQVLSAMIDEGTLVRLDGQIYMHRSFYDKAVEMCKNHIAEKGSITLAEFRDLLGTSRKYAMAVLDNLDRQKITKKTGDFRVFFK